MREHISNKIISIAVVAVLLYTADSQAGDSGPGTSMFSFSGFGTLGVVHSSEENADFTSSNFKPDGAGFSDEWSVNVDSRIAAQVTANFTPRISAVVQVISEQRYDDTYKPTVEWANIKYQFTPNLSARIGRIMLPVFSASDFRKVGYANPWVRPPMEVYYLLPVTNSDGASISYRLNAGDFTNTVQGNFGRNDLKGPNDIGTAKARDLWGFSNTIEYGAFSVRIAYQRLHLTIDSVNPFFDTFRLFGPQGIAIADKYGLHDKPFEVEVVGASYDPGKWFVMGEWGHSNTHSFFGKNTGWYAGGGYRAGKFTTYLNYAQIRGGIGSDPGLTASDFPPSEAGNIAALNAGLNGLLGQVSPVQKTVAVGGRWDFMENLDLKLQYDHTNLGAGSSGTLINVQPAFERGGTVNVVSATVDFVF